MQQARGAAPGRRAGQLWGSAVVTAGKLSKPRCQSTNLTLLLITKAGVGFTNPNFSSKVRLRVRRKRMTKMRKKN